MIAEFDKRINLQLSEIIIDTSKVMVAFNEESKRIKADPERTPPMDADELEDALADISNKLFDLHFKISGRHIAR